MQHTTGNTAQRPVDSSGGLLDANFDEIYDSMVQYVWNVVSRMGVSRSDAEDVVQEVFVIVHRRLDDFEGRAQLKTWVFKIALHVVQHYFRTHARKPGDRATAKGTEIHSLVERQENGPAAEVERMERRRTLDRLLDQLDESKRAVFVLAELEQLTLSEIAEIVESNTNTVASRLRAARQAFEKALSRFRARELERKP
jgi:RNA polymerase sigma-70 factor (ECF subfamily)